MRIAFGRRNAIAARAHAWPRPLLADRRASRGLGAGLGMGTRLDPIESFVSLADNREIEIAGGWFAAGGSPLLQDGGHTRVEDPSRLGGGISFCFVGHTILVQWQPLHLASYFALLTKIYLTAIEKICTTAR